jgi:HD-like signal output (HDOD) protein
MHHIFRLNMDCTFINVDNSDKGHNNKPPWKPHNTQISIKGSQLEMDASAPVVPDKQEIRYRIAQISDLPPLTGALQRLLEIIYNEVASSKELENVILYDQFLAAKVLRLANSPFYGRRGDVTTITKAIMLVGFDQIKSICLCTILMQLFADGKTLELNQRERLWKHAFATALIASGIARIKPWISKDVAYVLGLLHDIGRLAMAVHFCDYYRMVSELAERRNIPPWIVESQWGIAHTEIGRWMCIKWALPEMFRKVTEFHHQPHQSPSHRSEVTLVYLADVLAHSEQFPEYVNDQYTLSCTRQLFLTEEDWELCVERSHAVWPQVDVFWSLLK